MTHGKKDNKKLDLKQSKKLISRPDNLEGGVEHEITAQVTLPQDGGWGWMVVAAAFLNVFILDGVAYTFGSLLHEIADDLSVADSLVAFLNSIAISLYFICSPFASALINRFGFRKCSMAGSITCSFSLLTSYFATSYSALCIFYGIITGIGFSLINLSSGLVVGFYFEKWRSLALSIATCGSSFGVMALFPINSYLVKLAGWRSTTLFHSSLFGLIFFFSMAFKPLLTLNVIKTEEVATCTVTYLPSVISTGSANIPVKSNATLISTATERLFQAVSNVNFPTAAAVIEHQVNPPTEPGPSGAKKIPPVVVKPQANLSQRLLKQVRSIVSTASTQSVTIKTNIDIDLEEAKLKKRKWWQKVFHWQDHTEHNRPMYRDDIFYEGKLEQLPAYQKSVMEASTENRTGLEYSLAVTRALTREDILESRGFFTTAIRRILATMMDPSLLKKNTFLLMCSSGFLTYLGFLVPYVYLKDRNLKAGLDPEHCNLFVSAISLSNAIGRLTLGALATKFDPVSLFALSCIVAGISTIMSSLSYNLYYQYLYCCVFGFTIACVACLRSIILVSLYGLNKLTNATGMMLIFLGLGNIGSTPLAGVIKDSVDYSAAFYVAGTFITCSGLIIIPVRRLSYKENKAVSSYHFVYSFTNIDPF